MYVLAQVVDGFRKCSRDEYCRKMRKAPRILRFRILGGEEELSQLSMYLNRLIKRLVWVRLDAAGRDMSRSVNVMAREDVSKRWFDGFLVGPGR